MVGAANRVTSRRLASVIIVGAVFGFGLLSPHGHARSARAQEVDRAAVVQRFIDARNAGDIDAALATVTANVLYVGSGTCAAATPCMGSDAVRRNLEGLKSVHSSVSIVSMQVSGSAVTGRVEGRGDPLSAAGIDRNVSTFIAQVPQDKIADWFQVPDLTDPQSAQYAAAQQTQAQQTLAPDPEPGPYAVGVTRRTFVRASSTTGKPRSLNTVIWYPADAAATAGQRDAVLGAPLDAAPARTGAPYPVLLYSHGNLGQPWNATFLATHLASYGFVVIAPPHPGNTPDTCPAPCAFSNPAFRDAWLDSLANRTDDISFALSQALSLSATDDALFAGLLDSKRAGMTGWPFGGATAVSAVARDGRFLAGVALAPGRAEAAIQLAGPVVPPLVTRPMMVMSGMLDDQVSFPSQQDLFTAMSPSGAEHWFVAFPHTGHFNFGDFCLSGRAGCRSDDLPQTRAHLLINRWATAFLVRYVAGDERQAASLDAALAQDDPEVVVTRAP